MTTAVPAAAVPAAPITPPSTPWYNGADAEIIGEFQNRGLADKDPATVALEMGKAYREARKFIGVSPDKLLKIPDPNDTDGVRALKERLGAPKDAKDYDFKTADGKPLDAALDAALRETALKVGLPKGDAADVAAALAKYFDQQKYTQNAEYEAKIAAERQDLDKNWGVNKAANLLVAQQAAKALGLTGEEVNALEKVAGYAKVMEMLRSIGEKTGEAKFITSNAATSGVMTREQALAEREILKNDVGFRTKYLAGDAAALRQMTALNTLISGG